jgi:dCTP deaminase
MSILSAQTIRKLCLNHGLVTPFVDRTVHQLSNLSYGLGPASYDLRIDQDLIIPPKGFVLGSTFEQVNIPNNIIAFLYDKSSLIRQGISLQNTLIDPGFYGFVTVEISNHLDTEFKFHKGMPVAQMVFQLLDEPTIAPYNGKYQGQKRGPVAAK